MENLLFQMFRKKETPKETQYPRLMNAYQVRYIGAKHRSISGGTNHYAEVWQLDADTFQLRIKGKYCTLTCTQSTTNFSRVVEVTRFLTPKNEGKGILATN